MFSFSYSCARTPKVAVIFVVDQCAHHYLEKIQPHLKKGMKLLFDKGVVYNYAYHPHSNPSTSTGHTALSTGCFAKDHGIIGNRWFDFYGKTITCNDDFSGNARVFSPKGLYDFGKSAASIKVDGLSDQFVNTSKPHAKCEAFALSYKDRVATSLASRLGKGIWFDHKAQAFTSSKFYFEKLPEWVEAFNWKNKIEAVPPYLVWQLKHPGNVLAYDGAYPDNYKFTSYTFSLLDTPLGKLNHKPKFAYDELFIKTPYANQLLLDLAKRCVDDYKKRASKNDKLILWIGLSPLDIVGHFYGPDSKEAIDMLYYLDYQIGDFMKCMKKYFAPKDTLFALTGDHGVMPIIELLQDKGFSNIVRLDPEKLISEMNEIVERKFGVKNVVQGFQTPQFYLNKQIAGEIDWRTRIEILSELKFYLRSRNGIQEVWTYEDLESLDCDSGTVDWFYKNQMYLGRSGDLTCKCFPYCAITKYPKGTHHRTPYEYDLHVPLVLYQKGNVEKKKIDKKVWMLQFPNTIAKIFGIPGPAASTFEILPGV